MIVFLTVVFLTIAFGNVEHAYAESRFDIVYAEMQRDYPEGMSWTNNNTVQESGWTYSGCWAFATIFGERLFGGLPERDWGFHQDRSKIAVGDIISMDYFDGRTRYYVHTMVVVDVQGDTLTIAEGNINAKIHYGRKVGRYDHDYLIYHAPNYDAVMGSQNKPAISVSKVSEYVTRCYELLLQRSPDETGRQYWVEKLSSGALQGAEIVRQFVNSKEFLRRGLSNGSIVEILYRCMMDRDPDSDGRAYWEYFLNLGMSVNYLVNGFVSSQEFKTICSNYGISAGSISLTEPRDKNPNITGFVSRCYWQALCRNPDTAGLNNWCGGLLNRSITPKAVATQFVFSNEAIAQNWDITTFLTRLYRLYLGRDPDAWGAAYWTDNMNSGMDRSTVNNNFADSTEFAGICMSFGL